MKTMERMAIWTKRLLMPAAFLLTTIGVCAAQSVSIPVVLPLTGGAAFLGQGERTALQIAEKVVNEQGGIGGAPVHFDFHDDQSSPQVAVQLASQIKADNPPIIIGSAIVAMCNAMAPLMQDGPVMYCLSPGIHPAAGSRVFTAFISTHDLARALVRYYRGRGFSKLAIITSTDASGQDGRLGFEEAMKQPENAGMTMVASVQFNPTDVSVAAQIQQIASAGPQAVIAWTTGSPMGTVLKGIVQSGLDVPVGTTDANMTNAQMQQYASFLPNEMLFMSSEWPPHGATVTLDPKVVAAQTPMFAAYAASGVSPDISAALAWDAGMLAVEALRGAGRDATPQRIRAFLAGTKDWGGINGIYDFAKVPQRGLDQDDAVVTRWLPDKKTWTIVSKPGGAPF
jgi:branched-chain amino acid transport system substrate-binding protein